MSPEDAAWLAAQRPWLMRLARQVCTNDADAEDVVQTAITPIVAKWTSIRWEPNVPLDAGRRKWLLVVVARAALRMRAKRSRAFAFEAFTRECHSEQPGSPSPEEAIAARELLPQLETATTPERWRAWVMREVAELPTREIARQEGVAEGTISTRLLLARRDFAAALAREAAALRGPSRSRPFGKRRT